MSKKIIRSSEWKEKQRLAHLGQKAWNKGVPLSEEQKEHLRHSQLESYRNGRIAPNKGKYLSEKTKEKIRLANLGNKKCLGKHPSLKIDFEYDGEHWHKQRKENDVKRDKELVNIGWITFRINKQALKLLSQQPRFALIGAS